MKILYLKIKILNKKTGAIISHFKTSTYIHVQHHEKISIVITNN